MRILVGTREVAGLLHDFAEAFRSVGHEATSVIFERNAFYPNLKYDVQLDQDVMHWRGRIAESSNPVVQAIRSAAERGGRLGRLLQLMLTHDVFVYVWAGDSLRWNTELPYLRAMGKRIITVCCGSDVRHASAYGQEYADSIRAGTFKALRDLRSSERTKPVAFSLGNLRAAEWHSDVVLSQPNQSGLAVRPYHHLFLPVDLSAFDSNIPGRAVPRVIHAPSSTGMKGSDLILPALERLKSEGIAFDLQFLHGVSNAEVLRAMSQADVMVDQLHFPLHGKAGVEAMASGCALATCNREDYEPFPPSRPIWHIDSGNVYGQLRQLLTQRDLRVRLAQESLEYVGRYHAQQVVAQKILDHLEESGTGACDHFPSFFARDYRLEEGADIPQRLQRLTERIVRRWGLPEGIDPKGMAARGLMSWTDPNCRPDTWSALNRHSNARPNEAMARTGWPES